MIKRKPPSVRVVFVCASIIAAQKVLGIILQAGKGVDAVGCQTAAFEIAQHDSGARMIVWIGSASAPVWLSTCGYMPQDGQLIKQLWPALYNGVEKVK